MSYQVHKSTATVLIMSTDLAVCEIVLTFYVVVLVCMYSVAVVIGTAVSWLLFFAKNNYVKIKHLIDLLDIIAKNKEVNVFQQYKHSKDRGRICTLKSIKGCSM